MTKTTIAVCLFSIINTTVDADAQGIGGRMHLATDLPGEPTSLVTVGDAVYLVLDGDDDGLVVFKDGKLTRLVSGDVGGAAMGPDRRIYYTADSKVFSASLTGAWQAEAVDGFGDPPAGLERVSRMPDGSIWVEGCSRRRLVDGSFVMVPGYSGESASPVPAARDLHENHWAIAGYGVDAELLVLPANAPEAWQLVPSPSGSTADQWDLVMADDMGMVWIGGKGGLRQLDPHTPDNGWKSMPGAPGLLLARPTALGLSPDGHALAGLVSGQVCELDLGDDADLLVKVISEGSSLREAISALATDDDGNTWVGAGSSLYRIDAHPRAWQRHWRALGRIPGSNHDIFAVELDGKLYTSGGATAGWGYPATQHLFDELWVYDSETDVWSVAGHMPFHRCYNGITALDGEVWNVGGAIHEEDNINGKGPRISLEDVDIYDPGQDSWRSGPPLLTARQEPVVVNAGNRVYAIGGGGPDRQKLSSVESIGAGEDRWRFEPELPVPMRQYAGCVLDGTIYVVGREGAYSFTPGAGSWETLPEAPQLPQASQIGAHAGEVWVLGSHKTKVGYRYSPAEKTWKRAPDLPTPNSWGAAAELHGQLIVAGGAHGVRRGFTFDDRVYALRLDWEEADKEQDD